SRLDACQLAQFAVEPRLTCFQRTKRLVPLPFSWLGAGGNVLNDESGYWKVACQPLTQPQFPAPPGTGGRWQFELPLPPIAAPWAIRCFAIAPHTSHSCAGFLGILVPRDFIGLNVAVSVRC